MTALSKVVCFDYMSKISAETKFSLFTGICFTMYNDYDLPRHQLGCTTRHVDSTKLKKAFTNYCIKMKEIEVQNPSHDLFHPQTVCMAVLWYV